MCDRVVRWPTNLDGIKPHSHNKNLMTEWLAIWMTIKCLRRCTLRNRKIQNSIIKTDSKNERKRMQHRRQIKRDRDLEDLQSGIFDKVYRSPFDLGHSPQKDMEYAATTSGLIEKWNNTQSMNTRNNIKYSWTDFKKCKPSAANRQNTVNWFVMCSNIHCLRQATKTNRAKQDEEFAKLKLGNHQLDAFLTKLKAEFLEEDRALEDKNTGIFLEMFDNPRFCVSQNDSTDFARKLNNTYQTWLAHRRQRCSYRMRRPVKTDQDERLEQQYGVYFAKNKFPLVIAETNGCGFGVQATGPIAAGVLICIYAGKVRAQKLCIQGEQVVKEYDEAYSVAIADGMVIEAERNGTDLGGYFNEVCDTYKDRANVEFVLSCNGRHVEVWTTKEMRAGDWALVRYGPSYRPPKDGCKCPGHMGQ